MMKNYKEFINEHTILDIIESEYLYNFIHVDKHLNYSYFEKEEELIKMHPDSIKANKAVESKSNNTFKDNNEKNVKGESIYFPILDGYSIGVSFKNNIFGYIFVINKKDSSLNDNEAYVLKIDDNRKAVLIITNSKERDFSKAVDSHSKHIIINKKETL